MRKRPAVLFLNNYPMADALELWRKGEYPGQHLWGANGLGRYGFDVHIPKYSTMPRVKSIVERHAVAWGDCDQQLRAMFRRDYDIIYSACQSITGFLARLHSMGLFRKPLVALIHHELSDNSASRAFLRGHTRLLCLSRDVRDQLIGVFQVPKDKVDLLSWGPELEFYRRDLAGPYPQEPWVVSIGKTLRDHDTLAAAMRGSDIRLTIIGTAPTGGEPLPNIEVIPVSEHINHLPYRRTLEIYQRATIVAIPLASTRRLAGLSSLLDAMAMGKPVVMTRNPLVDIDIEAEGFGVWLSPGDVAGWKRAVEDLAADSVRCREMGRRARLVAESRYNIQSFTAQLAEALKRSI